MIREWEAVHMYQLISAFAGIQDTEENRHSTG